MYQLEVKAYLVEALFPASEGWTVTVDVDAMERARGGTHPSGKRERAQLAEARLEKGGARLGAHPVYGRADVVAEHPEDGVVIVEVEGESSRQREQAVYSALGQLLIMMRDEKVPTAYALAVPDNPAWERQLAKVPATIRRRLNLSLYLVSESGVRDSQRTEG